MEKGERSLPRLYKDKRMKKRRFTIGDIVEVDKEKRLVPRYIPVAEGASREKRVIQRYNQDSVHGNAYKEIRLAVITGMKRFIEGEYYPSNTFYDGYNGGMEVEPGGVIQENIVTCWAVRTGYLNRELYFFEEDLKEVDPIYRHDIPFLDTGWNDKARKDMSRWSKDFNRDERGRFC